MPLPFSLAWRKHRNCVHIPLKRVFIKKMRHETALGHLMLRRQLAYGQHDGLWPRDWPCGLTIFGTGRTEGTAAQGKKGIKMSGDSIRALCIRRTLSRHVTMGTPTVIFCYLTVFDCS